MSQHTITPAEALRLHGEPAGVITDACAGRETWHWKRRAIIINEPLCDGCDAPVNGVCEDCTVVLARAA